MSYLLKLVFFLLYTMYIGATILFIKNFKNLKNKEKILDGILAIASLLYYNIFSYTLNKKIMIILNVKKNKKFKE